MMVFVTLQSMTSALRMSSLMTRNPSRNIRPVRKTQAAPDTPRALNLCPALGRKAVREATKNP